MASAARTGLGLRVHLLRFNLLCLSCGQAHEQRFDVVADGFYRTTVCGTALSNLTACASSDGFYRDTSPPIAGDLCIGKGPRARCLSEAPLVYVASTLNSTYKPLRAYWHGFLDNQSGPAPCEK